MLSHGTCCTKSLLLVQYLVQCSRSQAIASSVSSQLARLRTHVNISYLPRLYANLYQYPVKGLAGIQTPDYGWRSPAVGINL